MPFRRVFKDSISGLAALICSIPFNKVLVFSSMRRRSTLRCVPRVQKNCPFLEVAGHQNITLRPGIVLEYCLGRIHPLGRLREISLSYTKEHEIRVPGAKPAGYVYRLGTRSSKNTKRAKANSPARASNADIATTNACVAAA